MPICSQLSMRHTCARAERRGGHPARPVDAAALFLSPPRARKRDAVVVGGGHNGLVAAAYLAEGGHRNTVLGALLLSATLVGMDACDPGGGGCQGCATHPGVAGHRRMYEMSYGVIKKALGW